jgi:hypothetical protein
MHVDDLLRRWMGQSTTGQGFAVLIGLLGAYAAGQLTMSQALAIGVPALVLVLWPQSANLGTSLGKLAGDTATLVATPAFTAISTDVEGLISAYRIGATHGVASLATTDGLPPTTATTVAVVTTSPTGSIASSVAGLILVTLMAVSMAACSPVKTGQTIAGVEASYTAASILEVQAYQGNIPGVKLTAADVAEYKRLDNVAYVLIRSIHNNHLHGVDPTTEAVLDASSAVTAISAFLASKGVKQ